MSYTRPLPKWAMFKYAQLWNKFRNQEFDHSSAAELLKEENLNLVSVLFSYLKRNSWITIKLDPRDSRKRIYQLKAPENAVEQMIIIEE